MASLRRVSLGGMEQSLDGFMVVRGVKNSTQ